MKNLQTTIFVYAYIHVDEVKWKLLWTCILFYALSTWRWVPKRFSCERTDKDPLLMRILTILITWHDGICLVNLFPKKPLFPSYQHLNPLFSWYQHLSTSKANFIAPSEDPFQKIRVQGLFKYIKSFWTGI